MSLDLRAGEIGEARGTDRIAAGGSLGGPGQQPGDRGVVDHAGEHVQPRPVGAADHRIGQQMRVEPLFAAHAVEFSGRYLLAVGGIVIGGVMSIATLAGRHFNENLVSRADEVEAWLSLGASPRQAVRELATHAIHHSLIPTTDQTRTTGLVALPGAFVGAIFGGASVLEAGVFQLVVLVSILTAGVITALLLTNGLSAVTRTGFAVQTLRHS